MRVADLAWVLSPFSPVGLFATPWTVALQVPLSMGFSQQEYWSGWPCPPPRHLPDPRIESMSPALQADSLPLSQPRKPNWSLFSTCKLVNGSLPGGSVVKNLPANTGETGLIPGSGISPKEGNGNPLQYSGLTNPMDRGGWQATFHWVAKESNTI